LPRLFFARTVLPGRRQGVQVQTKKILVAITGASGTIFARSFLRLLAAADTFSWRLADMLGIDIAGRVRWGD
jgi:hypothetical protein